MVQETRGRVWSPSWPATDNEEEEEEIRSPSRHKEKKGRQVIDDDSDE